MITKLKNHEKKTTTRGLTLRETKIFEFDFRDYMYHSICLTILFVLNGNNVFSILVVSTKKCYPSFLKKVIIFQKICFKVKVLKTFETLTDGHIKTCRFLKRRIILKSASTIF